MLTDEEIAKAKRSYYTSEERKHEHNDCVRIAYEWLDAQKKLKAPNKVDLNPLKHIIESWGGRYVSQSDVELAAFMYPEIKGSYPSYNISSRFTLPNARRLIGIGEAGKHPDYNRYGASTYSEVEP